MRLFPKITRRRLLVWFLILLLLAGGGAGYFTYTWRGSLPTLDGDIAAGHLSAPVKVERDALGVPTITAANRDDALFALGFLHGQERFFQMDLSRRYAAGELAELVGPAALEHDRELRKLRLRAVAQRAVNGLSPDDRAALQVYVEGVRTGLERLSRKPFEYVLLRTEPKPWDLDDSMLVVLAMYLNLQFDNPQREATIATMKAALPPSAFAWLAGPGSESDAPLEGGPFALAPIPGPDEFDLRGRIQKGEWPGRDAAPGDQRDAKIIAGSNNWAVAGYRTKDGRALVANDMHLSLSLPNIWYRARLVWPGADCCGVTLPGGPTVVAGSNGRVAWGYTNTQGDWADLIALDLDPANGSRYRTPAGWQTFSYDTETIAIKGKAPEILPVKGTVWGPVFDDDHTGKPRALRWVALDPEGVNFEMMKLMSVGTLEEALAVANRCGAPHQNFVAGDARGDIAWTILGRVPKRVGHDGRLPVSWADGTNRWDGYRPPEETPRIVRPASGLLWTANNRVVSGENLAKLGFGGYDSGARAGRIRDELQKLEKATEADMLRIQLDDRHTSLDRWHDLLLATAPDLKSALADWTGRADRASTGYRLVHEFRRKVGRAVLLTLIAPCRKLDPKFRAAYVPLQDGPVWQVLHAMPLHLLDPAYRDWDDFLKQMAADLRREFPPEKPHPWGEVNLVQVRHPVSAGLPLLSQWFDIPAEPLSGAWSDVIRIQGANFGSSERFAVSPGHEAEGYFHMPGGQSGHALSPHYRDGHAAWAKGEATAFLPGAAVHTLTLVP